MTWARKLLFALTCALACSAARGRADDAPRVLELRFTAVSRVQYAIWIERDGALIDTLALTRATATLGIGNRAGASQMNSGFRWPYGRREGALPIWAHRRAAAPGAERFRRVIFQQRGEGAASGGTSSDEPYFCLSFNQMTTRRDALDAVSCASTFNSDKGRYVTDEDLARHYAEPFETAPGVGIMRELDAFSLYPPRRDLAGHAFVGSDHADAMGFAEDARRVMPSLDAITRATAPMGVMQVVTFTIPDSWPDGHYSAWIEVNREGDLNHDWMFATPQVPEAEWDSWAVTYGYSFRGQPSVAFSIPFDLSPSGGSVSLSVINPEGYGSIDGIGAHGGDLRPIDATISNDPIGEPGSGADRLLKMSDGARFSLHLMAPDECDGNAPPSAVADLSAETFDDEKWSHVYGKLAFRAASDDDDVTAYEVRVSTSPITSEATFLTAQPAVAATIDSIALQVPTDVAAGEPIAVDFGGLAPLTHYYVAVRARDACNRAGELRVAEMRTTEIHFTTVTPCFVATAAYGSPLARDIGVLRRFRDRHLMSNALGRRFVDTYYAVGPTLARWLEGSPRARVVVRSMLALVVGGLR